MWIAKLCKKMNKYLHVSWYFKAIAWLTLGSLLGVSSSLKVLLLSPSSCRLSAMKVCRTWAPVWMRRTAALAERSMLLGPWETIMLMMLRPWCSTTENLWQAHYCYYFFIIIIVIIFIIIIDIIIFSLVLKYEALNPLQVYLTRKYSRTHHPVLSLTLMWMINVSSFC